jgi:hypothetical protein
MNKKDLVLSVLVIAIVGAVALQYAQEDRKAVDNKMSTQPSVQSADKGKEATKTNVVEAQPPAQIPRIGYLQSGPSNGSPVKRFRRGLRELGYVEGKNVLLERKFFEGSTDERLVELAEELVRL